MLNQPLPDNRHAILRRLAAERVISEKRGDRFDITNVGATLKALDNFERPVVLLAGGLSKGADLAPLVPKVREKVKSAVLIGEAAGEMERLFDGITSTVRAKSMDDAVKVATKSAAPGDVVLLSPACASMDMFRDYAERGNAFKKALKNVGRGTWDVGRKEHPTSKRTK